MRICIFLTAIFLLPSCSNETSTHLESDVNQAVESPSDPQPRPPQNTTTKFHACMIAGEFNIMGRVIRSRDCMQAPASVSETEFAINCTKLAGTSEAMGGKAGTITYMDECPMPAQGICRNFLGSERNAYYYERAPDDLATLPQSCVEGGGTWSGT